MLWWNSFDSMNSPKSKHKSIKTIFTRIVVWCVWVFLSLSWHKYWAPNFRYYYLNNASIYRFFPPDVYVSCKILLYTRDSSTKKIQINRHRKQLSCIQMSYIIYNITLWVEIKFTLWSFLSSLFFSRYLHLLLLLLLLFLVVKCSFVSRVLGVYFWLISHAIFSEWLFLAYIIRLLYILYG